MKNAILAAAFIAIPSALQAAVLVSYSATRPTTSVISHTLPGGTTAGGMSWRWSATSPTDRTDLGQAFVADTDFLLTSFTIFTPGASSAGGNTRPFSLTVEEFITGSIGGSRETVQTEAGVLPSLGSGQTYVTFTLTAPVLLEAGNTYGIRLSFTEATGTSSMAFRTVPGTASDIFMYYIPHLTSSTPIATAQNMEFWVGGTAIPEGSTVAFTLMGVLALATLKRHGKLSRIGLR